MQLILLLEDEVTNGISVQAICNLFAYSRMDFNSISTFLKT